MPLGLLFCFTPALIAWLRLELADEKKKGPKEKSR